MRPRAARDSEDGFTLVELLVVIIIIGILATIAIPAFLAQRSRANLAAMKSDLRNLASRAETFYSDELSYDGFELDGEFTSYQRSPGVVVVMTDAMTQQDDYCLEATHPRVDAAWRYDSDGAPTLSEGNCP